MDLPFGFTVSRLGECRIQSPISWRNQFTNLPIRAAVSEKQKIDPNGWLWSSVLASTGQPKEMT